MTVVAYVVSQRSQPSDTETAARAQNDRLHRLMMEKTKYIAFTRNGFQAEDQKHFERGGVAIFKRHQHPKHRGGAV